MDYPHLKGQAAVITGAGRGIGKFIALSLAEAGVNVVLVSRTISEIDAVAEAAEKFGVEALALETDVSRENEVEKMAEKVFSTFNRIDILVNNAGIPGPAGFITDIKAADWDKTIAINLNGMFLCSRAVIPYMINQKRGNIINVSSGAGKRDKEKAMISQTRSLVYSVSKFGVEGFTMSLASQVNKFNINVNAIRPGATNTRFHDSAPPEKKAKMRKPENIKPLALFLASQGPMGITGESIDITTWEKIYTDRGLI